MIKTGNSSTLRERFAATGEQLRDELSQTIAQLISGCPMTKSLYQLYQPDKKFADL